MAAQSIEFAQVSFETRSLKSEGGRRLLSDVSLRVEAGTTTALLGRSGSGKTTLLRTVNALVQPTSGRVLVGGWDVSAVDVIALRRGIGYVIQETGLFPQMTVERNVGMALELRGASKTEIAKKAAEMLELVGLPSDVMRRYPWQLSGGQRQRVGLARALAGEPEVLLMDEPFGALDPLTRAEMQTMLRGLLRRVGTTTLIVTHDLEEALYLAGRVALLEGGRVVAEMASGEVRTSGNEAVRAYVAATHRDPTHDDDAVMNGAPGEVAR
ncbi:ATP-binding cassette domain-containing protein [Granulicella sp. 5B5]|uniref:ATP-binding cassette domain-containing protein n=1 Tax=Granulicella sp. 5B5 TaxID=1617967 RepID=UPI0015F45052|nr:ABC transporter ATP-binding protein [Granulicella sp. 5B5]QMV17638.1 ATP-binding cassette domain-containing protein [Granulicella sp. 5B5]